MSIQAFEANQLTSWKPAQDFFVGIDSDGCAFDTMEIKHKECFCPNTIKWWDLQAVSKYARQTAEFINLYSRWRGANRWPALIATLDLLRDRPEILARQVEIPRAEKVRAFIASGLPLSDAGLHRFMAQNPDPELGRALAWTGAVNRSVADIVHGIPPFPFVRKSLDRLAKRADVVVVSATPGETLRREWDEQYLSQSVRMIAGQELGTKKQQLELIARDKYEAGHILMIGDALGDLEAARANGALFFPINPGGEESSWERFYQEGLEKFIFGRFAGEYEARLIAEFEKMLPETPPWKTSRFCQD